MVAAGAGIVIAADIFGKYKTVTQDIAVVVLLIGAGVCELTAHISGEIINYIGLAFFAISTKLYFLAIFPSKRSVKLAIPKTVRAIK